MSGVENPRKEDEEKYTTLLRFKVNPEISRKWLQTLTNKAEDDVAPLGLGMRYSPKAIRLMILESNAYHGESSLAIPNQEQFVHNIASYGYLMGFISRMERWLLDRGWPILGNFSQTQEDEYANIGQYGEVKVLPSTEKLADWISEQKKLNPELKTVLFHGKWNIPHIGHLLFIHSSLNQISQQNEVAPDLLRAIVVGERNRYISSAGSIPFMDTAWRLSLISYLPGVRCICPSGDIDMRNAGDYWRRNYRMLKPDFLPIEIGDKISESKIMQAEAEGVGVVEVLPVKENLRISSSGLISEGTMDDALFREEYKTQINLIGKSWRRKWF